MKSLIKTINRKLSIVLLSSMCFISLTKAGTGLTGMNFSLSLANTGSLLRGSICPSLDFNFNKSSFMIGPGIQTKKFNLSGIQCSYRYYGVQSDNGKLRLYFLANALFQKGAYLSNFAVKEETSTAVSRHSDLIADYADMKFTTIELYLGFGLNIKHSSRLSSSLSIGMGMYRTLGEYDRCNMYRDRSAVSMIFKYGLSYNLFTR